MTLIIRLDNLPWRASSLDIRQYFSDLNIPDSGVHIIGGEKGTAFIAFATDEDGRLAMLRDGGKICNEKIKLFLSSKVEMQNIISSTRSGNPQTSTVTLFGKSDPTSPVKSLSLQRQRDVASQQQLRNDGWEDSAPGGYETRRMSSPRFDRPMENKLQQQQRQSPVGRKDVDVIRRPMQNQGNRYFDEPERIHPENNKRTNDFDRRQGSREIFEPFPPKEGALSERRKDWMLHEEQKGRQYEDEDLQRPAFQQANYENRRSDYFGKRDQDFSRISPMRKQLDVPQEKLTDFENRERDYGPKRWNPISLNNKESLYQERFIMQNRLDDRIVTPMEIDDSRNFQQFQVDGSRPNTSTTEVCKDKGRDFEQDFFIHVTNIPETFNYREVRMLFTGCEIPRDGVKLVNHKDGTRKGECYIKLPSKLSFVNACKRHGIIKLGKMVSVERCSAAEFEAVIDSYYPSRKESITRVKPRSLVKESSPDLNKSFCLVMKNLDSSWNALQVEKLLGNVRLKGNSGPFVEKNLDGRSTGIALIQLQNAKEFNFVMGFNRKNINGKPLKVIAIPKDEFVSRRLKVKEFERARRCESSSKKMNKDLGQSNVQIPQRDNSIGEKFYCVRINGLSCSDDNLAVKEIFKGLEIANNGIHLVRNRDGQAAGMAFVEFVTSTDCRRAVDRTGRGQNVYHILPIVKSEMLKSFNELQQRYGDPGLIKKMDDCRPINLGREVVVSMKNLHFKAQLEDILQFFRGFHPLPDSVKIQYRNDRPTGDGVISFASLTEAKRAVDKLHHSPLLGWPLSLSLADI